MDPNHFLFVSATLITDLAWQVHREGKGVKNNIDAGCDREIGDGDRLQAWGYLGPAT